MKRVVEVDHHQPRRRGDIGIMAGQSDVPGAGEHAVLVPGDGAPEEVVARVAVGQRVDVDEVEALLGVGDHRIIVDRVEGLLLVLVAQADAGAVGPRPHRRRHRPVARRRDRLVGRQRHAGRVARGDARVLAERREGRGDDPLGEALVADAGDVVDAEAAAPFRDEHIFAAILQAADLAARALDDVGEFLERPGLAAGIAVEGPPARPVDQLALVALDVEAPEIGIGVAVEVGADHRLRLVPFGDPHRLEPALQPDPGVQADEVHEIGAVEQQLRHDRIVVVGLARKWQSVHFLVSVRRTVCGKCGAKAWLEKPAAEIGGCWT